MLDAAVKALSQILSPPMRSILWRSIGLALVLIVVLAIGLQRLLSWLAVHGEGWAEAMLGPGFHTPLNALAWIISIAAGLGVVFGAVFLMPAITSLVASVFVDEVADHVEREHYPAERPGVALPLGVAMTEGIKTALLTVAGLSDRAAVRVRRRHRLHRLLHRHRLAAGPGIFRTRRDAVSLAGGGQGDAQATMPRRSSPPACSSRRSCRSRSSIWRRRCSAWPSWSTCTSGYRPTAGTDRAGAAPVTTRSRRLTVLRKRFAIDASPRSGAPSSPATGRDR